MKNSRKAVAEEVVDNNEVAENIEEVVDNNSTKTVRLVITLVQEMLLY